MLTSISTSSITSAFIKSELSKPDRQSEKEIYSKWTHDVDLPTAASRYRLIRMSVEAAPISVVADDGRIE